MRATFFISAAGLLALTVGLSNPAQAACTLRFTAPGDGATVKSPGITVYGQGGADAQQGDSGTVTATLNGSPFFTYAGSFTAAVSFLQSRGVAVTLRPGLNFLAVSGNAGSCSASDSMTVLYDPLMDLAGNKGDPDDGLSCAEPSKKQSNPINVAIGNKYQQETDFRGAGTFPLLFSRQYNSLDGYWRHNYSTRLKISSSVITLVQADGRESTFNLSGGVATPEPTELGRLVQDGSGWLYSARTEERFQFDSLGRLLQWTNRNGQQHHLAYSGGSVTVTDDFGHSLSFTQDDRFQPLTLSVSGLSIHYSYDASARLTLLAVDNAGSRSERKFHYEDNRYPRFLTGITDERGVRYATWSYDDQGRAKSGEHAGAAEKVSIDYNADGSRTVTNELGRKTIYRFQVIQGIQRITAIEGEPSANCPSSNSTFTYDERGLLKTKTDNKGFATTFAYNERGLEESRTEAFGTPEARTVTTTWHPSLNLPATVTEPARITTYHYDAQGRSTGQTVSER